MHPVRRKHQHTTHARCKLCAVHDTRTVAFLWFWHKVFGFWRRAWPGYGTGIVGKCLGLTTSKRLTRNGRKIY